MSIVINHELLITPAFDGSPQGINGRFRNIVGPGIYWNGQVEWRVGSGPTYYLNLKPLTAATEYGVVARIKEEVDIPVPGTSVAANDSMPRLVLVLTVQGQLNTLDDFSLGLALYSEDDIPGLLATSGPSADQTDDRQGITYLILTDPFRPNSATLTSGQTLAPYQPHRADSTRRFYDRPPVQNASELPPTGNLDGDHILVLSEGREYYWFGGAWHKVNADSGFFETSLLIYLVYDDDWL
jgi:hypothetical protein